MIQKNKKTMIKEKVRKFANEYLTQTLREKTLVTTREEVTSEYPFYGDLPMIYLGEIANMKEHGIFIGKSGKCYFGYHISNFRELSEEEV